MQGSQEEGEPMNIDQLLPYFDHYQRAGNGKYTASCPMPDHNDSDPSVSISQDANTGNILMYCWGCNRKGNELVQAMGLSVRDLFGDPGAPNAVSMATQQQVELSEDELETLSNYVELTKRHLHYAEDYIDQRFGISVTLGREALYLGVDPGDHDFGRPEDYKQFNSGVPHLIIPFLDPAGNPVGMQGRRLIEGQPRWRSKSGGGWSKIGCFGWHLSGPVIITEGPSDALAVVGRAGLPALAVRGASLSAQAGINDQIRSWLAGREAIVIGDTGEAGEKFAKEISEGVGIPQWVLPAGYSDVCDYLNDGNFLDEAIALASKTPEPAPVDTRTIAEIVADLTEQVRNDLPGACRNDDLKRQLLSLPNWELENILTYIIANAGYGQRGVTQDYIRALRLALRAMPPIDGGDGGDVPEPINRNPNNLPEILWNVEDQLQITEANVRNAMNDYIGEEFYQAAPGQYIKVIDEDLVSLKDPGVKSMLGQLGHWRVINGGRETGHVPAEASKMVCDPSWECDISIIERRVEVPFMLSDGSIVSEPGFHEDSGVFLLPRSYDRIVVPEVPTIVTDEHVTEAKRIFEDVLDGFVFKDQASQSNLLAMTLTSPLRELFKTNPMVPMLTSTAPQSGSGKGTSVRVPLSTAGVGPHSLGTTAYNSDENEFEKKLVGKLLKKSTYIFLDNIRSQVNSAVLEQMLTAANYDGRTLGYSEVNSLSTLVLWCSTLQSTGSYNRDLTRRTVPVELIKNYKATWKHKNIEAYLADMRGQLIWACFVAARKWLQDGAPISEARLDGYTGWVEVIGGILEHVLGYQDFLGNLESFRRQQDEVGMTIDGILERWLTLYGEQALPARMAVEEFDDPALHQLLGLNGNPSARQVLNAIQRQLDSQRGHIVGNTHIWVPLGMMDTGPEGPKKHYQCQRLEQ